MELAELTASTDRLPPQNLEAEQAVLGSMLLEEDALMTAAELLDDPGLFYKEAHRHIFSAMISLYRNNTAVDLITLTNELKKRELLDDVGGPAYLTTLTSAVPTAANVEHYCLIVREKGVLRALIKSATSIVGECYEKSGLPAEQLLDKAEQRIFEIASARIRREAVPVKEIVKDSIELIDNLYKRKGAVTGLPTGFTELDQMLAGLQPADLIIVAGRPSMGKSAFALNVAENIALQQKVPVAVFSLEMSKQNLVQRMLCAHARISSHNMRTGSLSALDWPKLTQAAGKISELPIYIDDSSSEQLLVLRAKARRLKAQYNIGLIVLDYIQLMSDPSMRMEGRQQEISFISRSLKALARELNIPVIAISQLSRAPEQRGDSKRPMLSDLRESGAIEQDADVVLMIYREEFYKQDDLNLKGLAEVIIAKQRNGPVGTVKLTFLSEFTRFENLART